MVKEGGPQYFSVKEILEMQRKPLTETTSPERAQYATLHDAWEDIVTSISGMSPIDEHETWHASHGAGGMTTEN